jgi:outer membrane protein TolC
VVTKIIQNNPIIKESDEKITSSGLSIELVLAAYMPTFDVNASYSCMAPIPSFDIPQFGHIQANFVVGLSLRIPVFDDNRKHVKLHLANSSISQSNFELQNNVRQVHDLIAEAYQQV